MPSCARKAPTAHSYAPWTATTSPSASAASRPSTSTNTVTTVRIDPSMPGWPPSSADRAASGTKVRSSRAPGRTFLPNCERFAFDLAMASASSGVPPIEAGSSAQNAYLASAPRAPRAALQSSASKTSLSPWTCTKGRGGALSCDSPCCDESSEPCCDVSLKCTGLPMAPRPRTLDLTMPMEKRSSMTSHGRASVMPEDLRREISFCEPRSAASSSSPQRASHFNSKLPSGVGFSGTGNLLSRSFSVPAGQSASEPARCGRRRRSRICGERMTWPLEASPSVSASCLMGAPAMTTSHLSCAPTTKTWTVPAARPPWRRSWTAVSPSPVSYSPHRRMTSTAHLAARQALAALTASEALASQGQRTKKASPRNFITSPPWRAITPKSMPKYALQWYFSSSADIRAESIVKPEMSTKKSDPARENAQGSRSSLDGSPGRRRCGTGPGLPPPGNDADRPSLGRRCGTGRQGKASSGAASSRARISLARLSPEPRRSSRGSSVAVEGRESPRSLATRYSALKLRLCARACSSRSKSIWWRIMGVKAA
mmetsp:Transcript_26534/g.94641  ORF Transcript_26534/g.94641 Transcript_26534/m.94641 type:complete len:542 (-) Transcript_26534:474-2099(-)